MFKNLKCLSCNEADCIMLHLDDCTTFQCRECEDTFTVEDVQAHLAAWRSVLDWVDAVPTAVEKVAKEAA